MGIFGIGDLHPVQKRIHLLRGGLIVGCLHRHGAVDQEVLGIDLGPFLRFGLEQPLKPAKEIVRPRLVRAGHRLQERRDIIAG